MEIQGLGYRELQRLGFPSAEGGGQRASWYGGIHLGPEGGRGDSITGTSNRIHT
ncbi:hypothetical protein P7K49_018463, partial [Saguinus oedipus]